MKKFLSFLSFASLLFLNILFFIPFSQATTTEEIVISAPTNRLLSGSSALQVQLTDLQGNSLGFPAYVSLNLSVISSATAWLTSIAALLLLIGVIAQSVRRFKSNKQEELSIEN